MAEVSKISYRGSLHDIRDEVFGLRGPGAPTIATVGTVGQLYEDTVNGKLYVCVAASSGSYSWEEVVKNALLIKDWTK